EILISATHTHTGPYTLDIFEGEADQDYLNFLEQEVLLGFEEALNNLQPASLRITRTEVEKISCNRRMVFADGTVHTHITEKDLDKSGSQGFLTENIPDEFPPPSHQCARGSDLC
ncbi:MAG: hypothetical protein H3C63_07485, partial [Candidatus Omnitrophica bacterium]|nr:hypothetical protein [Candidatus Omnitrophota bacterium]